jgi:hypothetical protein
MINNNMLIKQTLRYKVTYFTLLSNWYNKIQFLSMTELTFIDMKNPSRTNDIIE